MKIKDPCGFLRCSFLQKKFVGHNSWYWDTRNINDDLLWVLKYSGIFDSILDVVSRPENFRVIGACNRGLLFILKSKLIFQEVKVKDEDGKDKRTVSSWHSSGILDIGKKGDGL
jgi:hypothetical protein